ncbi:hypothetical protein E1B28_001827 [Marasmius oreades]|uniref:NAD(P)-binding protein n=1 Tax=Marasmius oreades TaxID=181124 RepID=A0A9P7V471_9AGAR|nr:uncharacterized protein E1B28_001827 [Marasmius oreades]KAG7100041.1 hypothetical protein E1B28_001827 [Marasmius oreades]
MIALWEYVKEAFPPAPKFKVEDIPDQTGKVIIVTGGNSGLGYETVKVLLSKNAKVYMASRSKDKADAAIQKLKEETGNEAYFLELDLADLDSVKKATDEFNSKEEELHVLFNNAGLMVPPIDDITVQGYDMQFGVNVIGHYVLTKRLLPPLFKGAESSSDHKARIVNTSSSAQLFANDIDFETIKDGAARRKAGVNTTYLYSKFANVVLAHELARRYADKGIVSTSLNPGNLRTDIVRTTPPIFQKLAQWFFAPASYGALSLLWAGVSPDTVDFNGKYIIPWARMGKTRPEAADPQLGERLWKFLESETKE